MLNGRRLHEITDWQKIFDISGIEIDEEVVKLSRWLNDILVRY